MKNKKIRIQKKWFFSLKHITTGWRNFLSAMTKLKSTKNWLQRSEKNSWKLKRGKLSKQERWNCRIFLTKIKVALQQYLSTRLGLMMSNWKSLSLRIQAKTKRSSHQLNLKLSRRESLFLNQKIGVSLMLKMVSIFLQIPRYRLIKRCDQWMEVFRFWRQRLRFWVMEFSNHRSPLLELCLPYLFYSAQMIFPISYDSTPMTKSTNTILSHPSDWPK